MTLTISLEQNLFRLGDGMFFGVLRGCARRDWRFARRSQLLGGVESHDIESHVICSLSESDRGTRWGVWGFEGRFRFPLARFVIV